jgi:hypothetical protein
VLVAVVTTMAAGQIGVADLGCSCGRQRGEGEYDDEGESAHMKPPNSD